MQRQVCYWISTQLTVSTSQRTSPGETLSPSFFSHLAMLPYNGESIEQSTALGVVQIVELLFDVHRDNKPQSWWVKVMASQLPGVVVNLAKQ